MLQQVVHEVSLLDFKRFNCHYFQQNTPFNNVYNYTFTPPPKHASA